MIEQLKRIGKEWKKGDSHRIYFNNLEKYFGLELIYYKSGNICGAKLDGEEISNSRAGEIRFCLREGKVWYDLKENKFYSRIEDCRTFTGKEMGKFIIEAIKEEANKEKEVGNG